MQITGKITNIAPKVVVGQKQTEKQSIRIEETEGQYPNSLMLDAFGKKIAEISNLKLGDEVTAEFNGRTSTHNEKTYNNLSVWRITKTGEIKQVDNSWDDLPF